ncbi:hypothetical protein [Niabella beijingensis]|uniref:hypothetical protein n=1 Tax=Niabella beijingensis TaxID=2872700 RepID=UPI001CBCA941|nr:hypothetical protein [Niabella beijingensis]MBZ4187942.1 hypothetical protein [Niabella beijingensis]
MQQTPMSNSSTSVAQEFYKIREAWEQVSKRKHWKLAVWVAQYQDIDIIDKFIETERLAIGVFENDIFFRFETAFKGDHQGFEEALWKEYQSWFNPPVPEKDVLLALRNDGVLDPIFEPRFNTESGFSGLLKELLRLREHLEGFEETFFCLYFPTAKQHQFMLGSWLAAKLKKDIPPFIRLVTIDHAADRNIHTGKNNLIVELEPKLDMMGAINNEMDKGGGSSEMVSPEARLTKQIRVVMDTILKKDRSLSDREVKKMLDLAKETGNPSTYISSLLVASQVHYNIKDHDQAARYADDAIGRSEAVMEKGDATGYHCWKACMMLKGALLSAKRKWETAITVYEKMAVTALKYSDVFFVMEGHRISGHLYYLRGRHEPAFEHSLLALVAGSNLTQEVIRQSTFLHAAHLAVFLGEKVRPKDDLKALEEQLAIWIGPDWAELISGTEFEKSTAKPRSRFLPTVPFK